ncbi:MAG TPA: hypothetical protein VLA52_14510 [Thermohalobaculum sp.]|nr:hypothetical protein [Thermohalobaculum sp.]
MPSNLPPGCSSPDGAIDHALETALDTLNANTETPEIADALNSLLPAITAIWNAAYEAGRRDGDMEAAQRLDGRAAP